MIRSWAASPLILAAPRTKETGDVDVVRVLVSKVMSGGATVFGDLILHQVAPDGTITDLTSGLALQAWGMAHLDSYSVAVTFTQSGRYTFLLYDTTTEDFHASETDVLSISGGGSGGSVHLTPGNPHALLVPSLMALNESGTIRVLLYGTGATLGGLSLYVVTPRRETQDITSSLLDTSIPFTFLTLFEMRFAFSLQGNFMFVLHNATTGDVICSHTDVAEWTSRIDQPISDFNKLRTEVQRNLSRVSQRR